MHKLPFDLNLDDIDILKALSNANNKIGELNGLVKALPNPCFYIFNSFCYIRFSICSNLIF